MSSQLIFFFRSLSISLLFFPLVGWCSYSKKEDRDQLRERIAQKNYPGAAEEQPLRVQEHLSKKGKVTAVTAAKKSNSKSDADDTEEPEE